MPDFCGVYLLIFRSYSSADRTVTFRNRSALQNGYSVRNIRFSRICLKQTGNFSVLIHVNTFCRRNFRKSWHRHDFTGQSYNKTSACGNLQIAYGYFEIGRSSQLRLIVSQAVLGLCNTDRTVAESQVFQLFRLFLRICSENNFLSAVYFLNNLIQLVLDAAFQLVGIGKLIVRLLAQTNYFLCQSNTAFAAFCP